MHPASLWGSVSLVVFGNVLAAVVAPSQAWPRFVLWLAS
jgi:hypothetical protein